MMYAGAFFEARASARTLWDLFRVTGCTGSVGGLRRSLDVREVLAPRLATMGSSLLRSCRGVTQNPNSSFQLQHVTLCIHLLN